MVDGNNEIKIAARESSLSTRNDPARMFENLVYADHSQVPQTFDQAADLALRVVIPMQTMYEGLHRQIEGDKPIDTSRDIRIKLVDQMKVKLEDRGVPVPWMFRDAVSSIFSSAVESAAKIGNKPIADPIDAITRMFDREGWDDNGRVSTAVSAYRQLQEGLARKYPSDSPKHRQHMEVAGAYSKTEELLREMEGIYTQKKMDRWTYDRFPNQHNVERERAYGQRALRDLSRKQEAAIQPDTEPEMNTSTALTIQGAVSGDIVVRPELQQEIVLNLQQFMHDHGSPTSMLNLQTGTELFGALDQLDIPRSGTWLDLYAGADVVFPGLALTSGVDRVIAVSPNDLTNLYEDAEKVIRQKVGNLDDNALDFAPLTTEQFLGSLLQIDQYGSTLQPVPEDVHEILQRAVADLRAGNIQGITCNNPVVDLREGAPMERGFSGDGIMRTSSEDYDPTAAISLFSFAKKYQIPTVSMRFSDRAELEQPFMDAARQAGYEKQAIAWGHYLFRKAGNTASRLISVVRNQLGGSDGQGN